MNFIVNRIISICIRTIYNIFCMRNKEWENPEILSWWKLIRVICPRVNVTTRVSVSSNMPYYRDYCCKSKWKVGIHYLQIRTMWSLKLLQSLLLSLSSLLLLLLLLFLLLLIVIANIIKGKWVFVVLWIASYIVYTANEQKWNTQCLIIH